MRNLYWQKASLAGLRKADGGSAAVEFAAVAPMFLAISLFIITVGMHLRAQNMIDSYARDAARGVSIGYMTISDAKSFVERNVLKDLGVAVTVEITTQTDPATTDKDVIVSITIPVEQAKKIIPMSEWFPGSIAARAAMRSL
ncbi:TadE family protein [Methylobacterium nonmethylotrophicum]|uniref:Pilus assembly protein n=1 Tax=Methylobacterium nonmethylotrophicum TaxID=1141884 RepID=A0A4Z0NWS0_9HYPH|nr:TadE family protein [Methylobacterium nonmethylotrophicum]TGE01928.1 pilus assembly protein [Methylobacterium nonmethylotrophicum]